MQTSYVPRGRQFVRQAILRALDQHGDYADARWGRHAAAEITKAIVGPVTVGEFGSEPAAEFFRAVNEVSILGRLSGLRTVPWDVPILGIAGASAHWVGEAQPAPMSRPTLTPTKLAPKKVVANVVVSREALMSQAPEAEAAIQYDLERAVVLALDGAFLDPSNAGNAATPSSITNGAVIAATGSLADDLAALVAVFGGDLAAAYFVCSPQTAVRIATTLGLEDLGARGGSLLGVPVLTTRHQVGDSGGSYLTLCDPTGIAARVDGIEVAKSQAATVQMSDTPDSPATAATVMVSLFQRNLVALRAVIYANWEAVRPLSVAVLELED